jgi:hypothetical protein
VINIWPSASSGSLIYKSSRTPLRLFYYSSPHSVNFFPGRYLHRTVPLRAEHTSTGLIAAQQPDLPTAREQFEVLSVGSSHMSGKPSFCSSKLRMRLWNRRMQTAVVCQARISMLSRGLPAEFYTPRACSCQHFIIARRDARTYRYFHYGIYILYEY